MAQRLGVPFAQAQSHRFPDDECLVTVAGPTRTVILYRSLNRPNDKLIELALAAEALRRLGAGRLVLAAPYLAYMRQDQAFAPGQAISQRVVAQMLSRSFDRVLTVNAHLHRTHDLAALFGATPAQNLSAARVIAEWLGQRSGPRPPFLLGPDQESAPLVSAVAERLGAPWATFAKTREGDKAVSLALAGEPDLRGRRVVLLDDICSSGATLRAAAEAARGLGADAVSAVVVHALFDEGAARTLQDAGVLEIVSTDAVSHPCNRIELASLLAGALADEIAP